MEAYLCVSPYNGVYPSQHYADFEAADHILAGASKATPLLWLAMFRPRDLRSGSGGARATGDVERTTAPVTSRHQALANLNASVPVLDRLFRSSVSEHAEFVRKAMDWLPGAMVTIEWWVDDEPFGAAPTDLSKALAVFDLDSVAGTGDLDALKRVTGLHVDEPVVPARLLLDHASASAGQQAKLRRILGQSHMRMVPEGVTGFVELR